MCCPRSHYPHISSFATTSSREMADHTLPKPGGAHPSRTEQQCHENKSPETLKEKNEDVKI